LEELVENLVKTWKMEASHKPDLSQWKTISQEGFSVQTNGGQLLDGKRAAEIGNYNALMIESEVYQKCTLSKYSRHCLM
jgi:hypothetical protein